MEDLRAEAEKWKGTQVKSLSFSAGYALAADYPDHSIEQLVGESDLAMYEEKSRYYRETRKKRRKRSRSSRS